MKWAQFKMQTVEEHLDYAKLLARASTIEDGAAEADVTMPDGTPVIDDAKELVEDFLDAATPFEGVAEMLADQAGAALVNMTDWVDKALGLVRFAVPLLNSRPLENLPF